MRTLVLGGIRSGKSRWAEQSLSAEASVRYIATGTGGDDDESWRHRVEQHRSRRPVNWHTVESTDVAATLRDDPHTATIVDDIGGWLTGVLDRCGWDSPAHSLDPDTEDLISAVDAFTAPLALVSPEVGLTVVSATAAGRRFTDQIGVLNQQLAQRCDHVVLVVAGQPLWIKS